MKFECPYCHEEIEITQSERAKTGFRKFEDHKAECFKKNNERFVTSLNKVMTEDNQPDDEFSEDGINITAIIRKIHTQLGRIPAPKEIMVEMMSIRAMREAIRK